jgi:hypothetical protein
MNAMIQQFIEQGIRQDPEGAAREVPAIVGHYIVDTTRLNAVYQAAKRVGLQPDRFALERLAKAIADAEKPVVLWDEGVCP